MSQDRHPDYAQTNSAGVVVDRHDDAYVEQRDSFIPAAEAHADEVHPAPDAPTLHERQAWKLAWDRAFHAEMDRLVTVARGN